MIHNAMTGKSPHEMLKELMKAGGKIFICQPCMKHAGISKDQILEGIVPSTPDVIQPELFAEGVRVMSW
jgi:predicted peroxiredoxin